MFVKAVPGVKAGEKGYYCSLARSVRKGGKVSQETVLPLGFVTPGRLPYLRAAYGDGDPAEILASELAKAAGPAAGGQDGKEEN